MCNRLRSWRQTHAAEPRRLRTSAAARRGPRRHVTRTQFARCGRTASGHACTAPAATRPSWRRSSCSACTSARQGRVPYKARLFPFFRHAAGEPQATTAGVRWPTSGRCDRATIARRFGKIRLPPPHRRVRPPAAARRAAARAPARGAHQLARPWHTPSEDLGPIPTESTTSRWLAAQAGCDGRGRVFTCPG